MNYRKLGYLAAAVLLALSGGFRMLWMKPYTKTWKIRQGEKPAVNPLKGWACWGENFSEGNGVTLAYVPVCWKDAEPEPGVFAFETLEQKYHFEEWRKQGTHLILRIVADSPSGEKEMEIPQWLYDAMNGDGVWYENEYGKGFSPNYENPVFQKAHTALLQALGKRYNQDAQIAFLQLGSLGHWGEWHVDAGAGIPEFPDSTVTDRYVQDYVTAFPDKKLLMRRPYAVVSEQALGLYDDVFGEAQQHREWMSWIRNGYISDQNGQQLPGAPDFWKYAPSGGEIASGHDIGWYFSKKHAMDTLSFIRESHTTYLGPHVPKREELTEEEWKSAQRCQAEMGYCFTIEQASLRQRRGRNKQVQIRWRNIGLAPFYEDWDVRIVLKNENGEILRTEDFAVPISDWGKEETFVRSLSGSEALPAKEISVWVGLVDPMTATCSVKLAVELEEQDGMYCLGRVRNL